jgi:hypothetical protein
LTNAKSIIVTDSHVRYALSMATVKKQGEGTVTYKGQETEVEFDLFLLIELLAIPMESEPTARPIRKLQIKRGWIRPKCCPPDEIATLRIGENYPPVYFSYIDDDSGRVKDRG